MISLFDTTDNEQCCLVITESKKSGKCTDSDTGYYYHVVFYAVHWISLHFICIIFKRCIRLTC